MMPAWREIGDLSWIDVETGALRPLSAGSGLVAAANALWVVADDMHHIVRLPVGSLNGPGHRIFPGDLPDDPKERKRVKPDIECLMALPRRDAATRLVAFPSGSKRRRVRGVELQLDDVVKTHEADFSPILHFLDERVPDLNIEGGAIHGETVTLLQRGNGKAGFNATIEFGVEQLEACLRGDHIARSFTPRINEMSLPEIDGVRLTFTDASVHEGVLYFVAAAESSASTYDDGKVFGSAFGRLDAAPEILLAIEGRKAEGLAHATSDDERISFFAVTDADDPNTASSLLEIYAPRDR